MQLPRPWKTAYSKRDTILGSEGGINQDASLGSGTTRDRHSWLRYNEGRGKSEYLLSDMYQKAMYRSVRRLRISALPSSTKRAGNDSAVSTFPCRNQVVQSGRAVKFGLATLRSLCGDAVRRHALSIYSCNVHIVYTSYGSSICFVELLFPLCGKLASITAVKGRVDYSS